MSIAITVGLYHQKEGSKALAFAMAKKLDSDGASAVAAVVGIDDLEMIGLAFDSETGVERKHDAGRERDFAQFQVIGLGIADRGKRAAVFGSGFEVEISFAPVVDFEFGGGDGNGFVH